MSVRTRVISQFGRPRGLVGWVAGFQMAHRSSNVRRNRWAVEQLELAPTDRVLEVGFGPGVAIEALAHAVPRGRVYGLDHSATMLRRASARNRAAVHTGMVQLRLGSVADLPAYDAPLDAILAVNSMGFWPEPAVRLEELRSLLRSGGRIAIVSQPRGKGATAETSRQAARAIEQKLGEAGFSRIRVKTLPLKPPAVCVIGETT